MDNRAQLLATSTADDRQGRVEFQVEVFVSHETIFFGWSYTLPCLTGTGRRTALIGQSLSLLFESDVVECCRGIRKLSGPFPLASRLGARVVGYRWGDGRLCFPSVREAHYQ